MAQKDITEKVLADYNDVFADIMNGFLFRGEQVISPDDLETTKDKSQYKADGKIHEQERCFQISEKRSFDGDYGRIGASDRGREVYAYPTDRV